MAKILKNTTGSDIELFNIGRTIEALDQLELEITDLPRLATPESISELTILINSGDIVVNDGTNDLSSTVALNWILYPDIANTILFDNSIAQLDMSNDPGTVQEAIEKLKGFRVQSPQFQYIGQMNYDQYLYSWRGAPSGLLSSTPRSGDASNGYRYGNSAPVTSLYTGKVVSASASITGIAVSTGSPASSIELQFELWKVGFNSEGTKLGDIIFNINSGSYTIGTFWNSSVLTAFAENQTQDVDVNAGDLLGLKFIRQMGSDSVVAITNTTVVLEIEGNV